MTAQTESLSSLVNSARNTAGLMLLADYGLIRVSGADAAEFLHSQSTSDVLRLAEGESQASALVDRKGHLQASLTLYRAEASYWILAEQSQLPAILERLEAYHFTEDVRFDSQTEIYDLIALQGPQTPLIARELSLPTDPAIAPFESGWVLKKSLTGDDGLILALKKPHAGDWLARLTTVVETHGGVMLTPEALETLRIEAGLPRYGLDMSIENLLPETGLQQTAVSYDKGCYTGQEVIARVRTYGSVQRALMGLIFPPEVSLPPLHSEILLNNQPIGIIKSSTLSPTLDAPIALAYLSRDHRVPNKILEVTMAGQLYTVKVVFLPFYTPLQATERGKAKYEEGLQRFGENQEAEAIALLREAIDLDPHLADAYEALGVILSRHEQYDEAITLMQRLAEIDPEAIMPHTNLSVFYMKKGMKDEAEIEKALATTLEFKKALAQKQQEKATQQAKQQQREALESKIGMFQEVLELDPEDALANYSLGNTYLQLGRSAEAIAHLERALMSDPKYTVAYLALGKSLEAQGQLDASKSTYEKGIEVAAKRGDLMPLQEMQRRLQAISNQ